MKNELIVISGSFKGDYVAVARDSGAFEHFIQKHMKHIKAKFWIRTRRNVTSYQSKRFTSIVINVRTLSQWSY